MNHLVGRIIAALALCTACCAHAAPGDLDNIGFGSGAGKVITNVGPISSGATAVALQPDGKIVAAGDCYNGSNNDFCVARYLPSGALDTSFGAAGKVITANGSGDDSVTAVALQADGKIIVAGYCYNGSDYDFCLTRYLPSGALDTSFATTGKVITPIASGASDDVANAIALQPDGKIVLVGYCNTGAFSLFCLARYHPSGALDMSFNATGKAGAVIGVGGGDGANAVALQPDGKIIVAGRCYNGSRIEFCLARFLPSGTLDSSFNSNGAVTTALGSDSSVANAIALQPDGKIVLAGYCRVSGSNNDDFCLTRYLPSGTLDTSFGTTGKVTTDFSAEDDQAGAIALQPDGKIVVAGNCFIAGNRDFCVARYLPSGALDPSFNSTGKVTTDIGSNYDIGNAVALQPDGKIVVAGNCYSGGPASCLARYEGGPFDARNCSMDIDGDNQVLATTDSLIHARVALGLTGNAVIGGITFASHATRTTWPAIRDYLVSQCGMSLRP